MNYKALILSLMGGMIGIAVRFSLIHYQKSHGGISFVLSLATLVINIIGSFIAGISFGKVHSNELLNAFFLIGLCGGMTTMSTCALESYLLIQQGRIILGCTNALLNLVLSIIFAGFGRKLSL